jgi:hypothetical protein
MDRASSGKSDPPCLKQDQIALFVVQRLSALFRSDRDRHSELIAIGRSELRRFCDRHPLGIGNREHFGTMIFFSSE